jgi:hypothetical protein
MLPKSVARDYLRQYLELNLRWFQEMAGCSHEEAKQEALKIIGGSPATVHLTIAGPANLSNCFNNFGLRSPHGSEGWESLSERRPKGETPSPTLSIHGDEGFHELYRRTQGWACGEYDLCKPRLWSIPLKKSVQISRARAHTLGASICHRFATNTDGGHKERLSRVISRWSHAPKVELSLSEQKCLAHLNAGLPPLDPSPWVHNTTLYGRGRLSGTPDAVRLRGKTVIAVAEFKTGAVPREKRKRERQNEWQAELQAAANALIHGLREATVCICMGGRIQVHLARVSTWEVKIASYLANHRKFVEKLNN